MPFVTYVGAAKRRERFVAPQEEYVDIVCAALESFELPTGHVREAAEGRSGCDGPDALFVYGNLMRGEPLHDLIRSHGAECVLLTDTPGRLVESNGLPALVLGGNGERFVRGELVRCRDMEGLVRRLDEVEGFRGFGRRDNLYHRTIVEVGMMDGHVRRAWAYVAAGAFDGAREIPSGDWREEHGIRKAFLQMLVRAHCGNDEKRVARAYLRSLSMASRAEQEKLAKALVPLADALERGDISERQLAGVTGRWAVEVD